MIYALPGVKESAVVGARNPDISEAVAVVVVLETSAALLTADDVAFHVRSRLTSFKIPRHIHFAEDLPGNAMGKVQKVVLGAEYSAIDGQLQPM